MILALKVAAVALAATVNWAVASCDGQPEPGLGWDKGKVQAPIKRCSSHWTDQNWTWDCGKYKEPAPVHTELPRVDPPPRRRAPNVGGQDPNTRAQERALQQFCEDQPNSPDCD